MYKNLRTQWASSIPAFLSLAFAPLLFVFLKFGAVLRARSKLANEAKAKLAKLQQARQEVQEKFENKHVIGMDFEDPACLTSQESETSEDKVSNLNHGS